MIYNQEDDSPKRRDQEAVQVEAVHANVAEHVKHPTANNRADNTKQARYPAQYLRHDG